MVYTENKIFMTHSEINIDKIRTKLEKILPLKRYLHSIGTEVKARELAGRFYVDADKAALAGLLHDCAKYMSKDEILQFVLEKNIPIPKDDIYVPPILHCFAGEYLAYHEYGIRDPEVLKAIRYHTLGSISMSDLDKVVYLADKIEDNTRNEVHFEVIRTVLNDTNNLDEAILISYSQTVCGLVEKRYYINFETIINWNYLLKKTGKIYLGSEKLELLRKFHHPLTDQ